MHAVEVTIHGFIGTITLNRPDALNAMNDELVTGVLQGVETLSNNTDVRAIIVTGAGRAFCAGGDLGFMESMTSDTERQVFIEKVGNMVKAIQACPKPIIAMVNGVAAGAGVNLMLACDVSVAVNTAKFIQSFVNVGLIPDCGGLWLLPRAVGMQLAKELMFTGRPVVGEEAVTCGLVTHMVDVDALYTFTMQLAQQMAAGSPVAIREMKRILNANHQHMDDLLADEASTQGALLGGADYAEGVAAFKEKRKPHFQG